MTRYPCRPHLRLDCGLCARPGDPPVAAAHDFPPAPAGLSQSQWERLLRASFDSTHVHAALSFMQAGTSPADALAETLLAAVADREELVKRAIEHAESCAQPLVVPAMGRPFK